MNDTDDLGGEDLLRPELKQLKCARNKEEPR